MKKYIVIIVLLLLAGSGVQAQTFSNDNFVYTTSPKKAVQSANFNTLTKEEITQNVTYFDGLGRPIQTTAIGQGGNGSDIITPVEYDPYGMQIKEYLPYWLSNSTTIYPRIDIASSLSSLNGLYNSPKYDNTSNPFSEKSIERSPLNRLMKQAAPGTSWAMNSGHEIKFDYQSNTGDEVKLYKANTNWSAGSGLYDITFSDEGNYDAKELFKNVTYNENTSANPAESSGSTVEFKNKEGRLILKRTYDAGEKHDTYYVYDSYGNLTYVVPPKVEGTIDTEILNKLCYQYKYDAHNRLVEKKLPGKQWEFIVYDKLDRPVATGPAFSPFKDDTSMGWLITKYDAFSRPIYTGWSNQSSNSVIRKSLQDAQDNTAASLFEIKATSGSIDGITVSYTNAIAPTSFKLLTVTYYDDYAFPNAPTIPTTIEDEPILSNTKGLATGGWTRVATTLEATIGETTATFYDTKARPIRINFENHLSGYTIADSKLDFTGKVLYTITRHKRTSGTNEITIREEFTYSSQDRLLTHTHQINGGIVELLGSNTYDELGKLISKNVGNNTGNPFQKVDFNYNIRGWLTEINNTASLQQGSEPTDLFAFKINYNLTQTGIGGVSPLYNGNIAETLWKTGSDATDRAYGYKYDDLNRLKNSIYAKSGLTTNAYDENLTYDKNGNIMSLNRKGDTDPQVGIIEIDNLAYTYPANSNQLSKVADNSNNTSGFNDLNITGDDYTYDENGNMITDKNKNISSISYNQLNLPKKITFGTTRTIEYLYNAEGQKVEKIVTEESAVTNTNYLGGFQYKDNVLQFFPTAEGYVKNDQGALSYVFQYKDHLGNVRLSFTKNTTTQAIEIIEENNYYPFGLKHKGYNDYVATGNKYKFQGKELEDEMGLNIYDFGLRQYDPTLGRMLQIDPVTHHNQSPYTAFDNNPVFWTDPDGGDTRDPIKDRVSVISSYVDKSNVTHITETTTNTTTTYGEDGSVNVNYSTSSISNTVDADGNVSKGSTVTQSSGSISKDSDGNVSVNAGKTTSRDAKSGDGSSALGQWTNTVSNYNKSSDGVYNVDKINKTADYTTKATKAGTAILGNFAGLNSIFGSLSSKQKDAVGVLGSYTSIGGLTGVAGDALKNRIGKNNRYAIIYGVQHIQNGSMIKEMKTPAGQAGGSRYSVGPTSWQGLWKAFKNLF